MGTSNVPLTVVGALLLLSASYSSFVRELFLPHFMYEKLRLKVGPEKCARSVPEASSIGSQVGGCF